MIKAEAIISNKLNMKYSVNVFGVTIMLNYLIKTVLVYNMHKFFVIQSNAKANLLKHFKSYT